MNKAGEEKSDGAGKAELRSKNFGRNLTMTEPNFLTVFCCLLLFYVL